jgi:hypothetical protein
LTVGVDDGTEPGVGNENIGAAGGAASLDLSLESDTVTGVEDAVVKVLVGTAVECVEDEPGILDVSNDLPCSVEGFPNENEAVGCDVGGGVCMDAGRLEDENAEIDCAFSEFSFSLPAVITCSFGSLPGVSCPLAD